MRVAGGAGRARGRLDEGLHAREAREARLHRLPGRHRLGKRGAQPLNALVIEPWELSAWVDRKSGVVPIMDKTDPAYTRNPKFEVSLLHLLYVPIEREVALQLSHQRGGLPMRHAQDGEGAAPAGHGVRQLVGDRTDVACPNAR